MTLFTVAMEAVRQQAQQHPDTMMVLEADHLNSVHVVCRAPILNASTGEVVDHIRFVFRGIRRPDDKVTLESNFEIRGIEKIPGQEVPYFTCLGEAFAESLQRLGRCALLN